MDPDFCRAYADLAYIYWNAVWGGKRFWDALGKNMAISRLLVRHYLELAMKKPNSRTYQLMASRELHKRNYNKATEYIQQALSISPNNADAIMEFGNILIFIGNPKEALKYYKKAIMLDPLYKSTGGIGRAYFHLRDYEQASKYLEKSIKDYPETKSIHGMLAATYSYLGDTTNAKMELDKFYT